MAVGPVRLRVMTAGISRCDDLKALSLRVAQFRDHVRPFMQSERRRLLA